MQGRGLKQVGDYVVDMNSNLGKGQFGIVRRCFHKDK